MEKILVEMLRDSLKSAHETLEGTMQGVTEDVAHFQPGGKALPIGAAYVHAVFSEDMLLNGMVLHGNMLVDGEWGSKLGLSAPHPQVGENWEADFGAWAKTVKVDLEKFREYAVAVYKVTDDYLAGLSDKDFTEQKIDLSGWGMGEMPLGQFIMRFIIGHMDNLTGEISAIKGVQNLKGYPF